MPRYEVEVIKEEFEFLKGITDEPFSTAFAAGEPIFREGEKADFLYIIESGTVEIQFQGIVLERISEGQMFGEMSLADDKDRSASATAHIAVIALAISKSMFLQLVRKDPNFSLQVMNTMIQRIRQMNVRIKISTDARKR